MIRRLIALSLLVVTPLGAASAQDAPVPDFAGYIARAVETVIVPGFAEVDAAATDLSANLTALCAAPTNETLATVSTAFQRIVVAWAHVMSLPIDPQSDDEIVQLYADAITPRTRLLMVCHMVNITGQILPVGKIADMARARGVDVMVDGAHAFGHFDYKIPDLHCDYYGTSLHKWLGAPLGAGLLYVRHDKPTSLWPIFGDGANPADDDALKLNHTGTHPVHTDLAIADAIAFHETMGIERKEARLRYLTTYWTRKLRGTRNVVLNTPADERRYCGIGNVGVSGMLATDLARTLLDRYQIWTVGIENAGVHGVRVTPHVFVMPSELDTFVKAIGEIAASA